MAVNFCIVSGSWPTSGLFGCGLESPIPLESQNPVPLGELGCIFEQIIPKQALVKCLALFEKASYDGQHEIERFRTFFTLMQNEAICCINFIPRDPHELQTIHVMRMQENQDPKEVSVFCHDNGYKYILPVERANYVFDLSRERVSETVRSFKPSLSPILVKALGYFLKDRQAKGLALTFHEEKENQRTYIWLK